MSLPPLQPEQLVKPQRFEARVALIFWALFIPQGVHLPYFPLWLEAHGFQAEQIAIILSAPMFLRVVTTPLITAMADRAHDRVNVLVLCVAAALFLSFGYFLAPTYATVLAVSLALTIVWTVHPPLTDSLALSGVRRFGSSYTAMRIWGSAAFLSANFFGGIVIGLTSPDSVPVMISAGLALTLVVVAFAPRLGRPRRASPLSAAAMQDAGVSLLNRSFLLIVTGVGVINASHALYYGFGSIYWKSVGIGDSSIGLLWSAAVLAEVGMFMVFTRLFGRVSTNAVLGIAGLAAMLRWASFPLIEPLGLGLPGFLALQTLHALSTGLLLIGVQKLIADTVAEERTGAAQGIAFFANGLCMAAVTLFSGALYEALAGYAFYVMVGVACAGLVIVIFAARSAPESRVGR